MQKIVFCFLFVVFFSAKGNSQVYMHGAGIGGYFTDVPGAYLAFTYSPRINFIENEVLSLSAGIPVSMGFSGNYYANYNSNYDPYEENTLRVMLNVPFIVNINWGAGSTKQNERRVGFFAGAGFGYHFGDTGYKLDRWGNELEVRDYRSSYGPAGNLGARFKIGRLQKNLEARFSFMKGINNADVGVFGIAALFNF
ncbi:MAG: hypothetical protein KF862_04675 [Chitinophagaceae bacterium]|nr:hypothetical protein [Chitinophagaceae bacterium]